MFRKSSPINKKVAFKRSDGMFFFRIVFIILYWILLKYSVSFQGSLCFGTILSKNNDGSFEVGWEEDGLPLGKRLDESEVVQVPFKRSIFPGLKIVSLVFVLVAFSYLSLSYYLDADKVSKYLFSIYREIDYFIIVTLIKDEPRMRKIE